LVRIREWIIATKLFWRIWLWWGIKEARKRRIENEKRLAAMPKLSLEEYWEKVAEESKKQ
jgi:thiamine kinase-like enzyme